MNESEIAVRLIACEVLQDFILENLFSTAPVEQAERVKSNMVQSLLMETTLNTDRNDIDHLAIQKALAETVEKRLSGVIQRLKNKQAS